MDEIWKQIPGYEGYYKASNLGRVRGVDRMANSKGGMRLYKGHILKQNSVHDGYMQVKFCINNKKSQQLVHRLIAMTFIPNPEHLPQVNHKDGNTSNNTVENLEWCTASQNSLHRNRVLKKWVGHPKKPVICLETGTVYESSHHAARALGITQGNIFAVCQGKWQTAGGLHFAFAGIGGD